MPVQTYLLSDVMGFMYQQANLNIPYILSQVRVYMYLAAKEGHTFLTKYPILGHDTPSQRGKYWFKRNLPQVNVILLI